MTVTQDAGGAAASMAIGRHFRYADYYVVSREKIREYARAVQDLHPLHWDENAAHAHGYAGLIAPLTFTSILGLLTQNQFFRSIMPGYDISRIIQTDQTFHFHRPVHVGDRLNCDVTLRSVRQAFGGELITTENVVTDENDEPVITTVTRLIKRAGNTSEGPDLAAAARPLMRHDGPPTTRPTRSAPPDTEAARSVTPDTRPRPGPSTRRTGAGGHGRRLDETSVGQQLPGRTVELTRGDLVNYAGVAGDGNPIHWSDDFAKTAGLDTVVAHGMLTMALGAGLVTSWLGDPGAVIEYDVRFTSPVFVPVDRPGRIDYTGAVKTVDPEQHIATVAIVATHENRKIFGRAVATVRLS